MTKIQVSIEVNGEMHSAEVSPRLLLSDYLRHNLQLTGTHVGCEQGVCGACTVQVDGDPVRACLMIAVQVDGRSIRTVEGMNATNPESPMHPLQEAFKRLHGLQCGFCTAGFLMSVEPELPHLRDADDDCIREAISGNICRCTGYQSIVDAVRSAANDVI